MTIGELIEAVRKKNDAVEYQWLNPATVGAQYYNTEPTKKKPARQHTEITFATDNEKGRDFITKQEKFIGVVVWLPATELREIMDGFQSEKARNTTNAAQV